MGRIEIAGAAVLVRPSIEARLEDGRVLSVLSVPLS
jgi:hypothetical protein